MKVAIVGSGISGLTTAYGLAGGHDITVFEAGDRVGGHANTVTVPGDGRSWNIDTGFIVYNESHYPLFSALLRELDVATQPTVMSFSVRHDPSGLEYGSGSANAIFAQRGNLLRPAFHRMWAEVLRFNREAPAGIGIDGDRTTVAAYVRERGYSAQFLDHYLVPLGSSLWSCPPGKFRSFPVRFVVDFLENHQMLQVDGQPTWRVISGGSQRYVERLSAGFADRIRTRTPIAEVARVESGVRLRDAAGQEGLFDHVVLACHADQALRLVRDPDPVEAECLRAFPYQSNDVLLHTDTGVLPRNRRAWSSWNYHTPLDDPGAVKVSYNMNILQGLEAKEVFSVSLNEPEGIDPRRVRGSFRYEHPLFTGGRARAQSNRAELIGRRGVSYCGAYWGFGFHEDGVRSATEVCRMLDARRAA